MNFMSILAGALTSVEGVAIRGTPTALWDATASNPHIYSYTLEPGATGLVVIAYADSGETFTSCEWNAVGPAPVAMTALTARSNGNTRCQMFYLFNPSPGTGAGTVRVLASLGGAMGVVPISITGWGGAAPIETGQAAGSAGSGLPPPLTLASVVPGSLIIHGLCAGTFDAAMSFTGVGEIALVNVSQSNLRMGASRLVSAAGGSVVVDSTLSTGRFADVAAAFAPPGQPPSTTDTWAYPLQTAFTDRGMIRDGTGQWDEFAWNAHSQGIVAVGSTCYLFYEAGDGWSVEHALHSKLGVLTSTNGINWSYNAANPLAEFNPGGPGGQNEAEEGYWYHAVWRRPNGAWTCTFGGQDAISASAVEINIQMQESSNGTTWSPANAPGTKIIDKDDTTFAGYGTFNDELGGGGLWYDETAGIWHVNYVSKNVSLAEEFAVYHAQTTTPGAALNTITASHTSNPLLLKADNPYVPTGRVRGGVILDRGNGVIDAIVHCQDLNSDTLLRKAVLARLPILPGYSFQNPGPAEILYYMSDDFGINAASRDMVGFFPGASGGPLALLSYSQFSDQILRLKTAPAVQTSDGLPPYTPSAVRFGPTETWLWTGGNGTSGFTPPADSPRFTFCCAVKLVGTPPFAADQTLLRLSRDAANGGVVRLQIVLRTTGEIGFFVRNSANTTFVSVNSAAPLTSASWSTVVVSVDTSLTFATAGSVHFYVNRTNAKPPSAVTYTTGTVAFSQVAGGLFGREGAAFKPLNAEVADFGFLAGAYFDLSDTKELNRFVTPANELQNPRVDGRAMFLKKAQVFFSGNAANFVVNRGDGGAFAVGGGTVTTTATPPAGHP